MFHWPPISSKYTMNLEDKVIKSLYQTTQRTYVVTSVKQNWKKILQNNVLQLTFTIGPFKRHCGPRRAMWPQCIVVVFPSPDNSTALPQSPQFSHPNAPHWPLRSTPYQLLLNLPHPQNLLWVSQNLLYLCFHFLARMITWTWSSTKG